MINSSKEETHTTEVSVTTRTKVKNGEGVLITLALYILDKDKTNPAVAGFCLLVIGWRSAFFKPELANTNFTRATRRRHIRAAHAQAQSK